MSKTKRSRMYLRRPARMFQFTYCGHFRAYFIDAKETQTDKTTAHVEFESMSSIGLDQEGCYELANWLIRAGDYMEHMNGRA